VRIREFFPRVMAQSSMRGRPGASAVFALLIVVSCDAVRSRLAPEEDAGPAPVAPRELAAAKIPPKPRPAPPVPPLPNLPILDEQDKTQDSRPALRSAFSLTTPASGGCGGSVWNGAEVMALPCARNGLLFGSAAKGARALIAPKLLDADRAAMPAIVDHRFVGLEGAVRDQRTSPSCTAFALAAAVDQAVARWTGKPSSVSVMEIWARYKEPYAQQANAEILTQTVAAETTWPFDERTSKGWLACEAGAKPPKEGCGLPPDAKRLAKLEAEPVATFTDVTYLEDTDAEVIKAHLAIDEDVIVTLELPETFAPRGPAGARYVPHWTTPKAEGGHAILVVGYVVLPKATYFLLHNSWGKAWGDSGYAWIHQTTLEKYLREALVIDAEPIVLDTTKQRRVRGAFTCQAPLVPDSMRGTCTPACPDGSPRSDGFCADASHCPAGQVNLTGVCVVAAPKTRGADPKSGISWACGPGGCTYELPRKTAPDCKGNSCKASCPAPIFRIATTGDDLTCIR
jgi:hypothetical protein